MKTHQENDVAERVVSSIKKVVGGSPAPLHEPLFLGNEIAYLADCVNSTFVSSIGKYVDQFEIKLAEYTGAKYAIAVVNGTSALHVALKLSGVEVGDEVLLPALNFVSGANAISYCGAIPHFIDSEESTLGVDFDKLDEYLQSSTTFSNGHYFNKFSLRPIKAILPMHTFGHPVNIEKLMELSSKYNLVVIEDAAESLGSFYKGIHTGTFGLAGIVSFNGNKTITTGGGGAIITNDPFFAKKAKHITTTAKLDHKWEYVHDLVGYNYRLPNINAALGCAQMENISRIIQAQRDLFSSYKKEFRDSSDVVLFEANESSESNYWLQVLLLDKTKLNFKEQILERANSEGYGLRPAWRLLNELAPYKECPKMPLDQSSLLTQRIINIPSSPGIILHGK